MLEESVPVMEKKGAPRQSSNSSKPTTAIERKNDPGNSAKYHGRYNRRRDNGSGRGTPPSDFSSRKPIPQKSRSALDKRPRQRGGYGGGQREEVAGVVGQPTLGRLQKGDGRHLLNFTFADREKGSAKRYRPRYEKNFSKERYLQANCQFVVKDSGDYSVQACDPDALVDWDLVEQVRTFSFEQTTCPICLQFPFAGKITRCGHVYCWACMLHYLSLGDKGLRKCPICEQEVSKSDLRSVKVVEKQEHKVGDLITLRLMKRARDSTYAVPMAHWEDRDGQPQHIHDELNTEYAKVLVASVPEIQTSVIEEERRALMCQLSCAEDSEICFIETALALLSERAQKLQDISRAIEENAALLARLGAGRDDDGASRESSSKDGGTSGKTATPLPPRGSRPLTKNLSFDGSKIRKQYADAFEELEEGSFVYGELSEHEDDEESTDSLVSLSSPSIMDQCQSLPLLIPPAAPSQASSEEDPLSVASDDSSSVKAPELREEEDTMTTEEAVEQLALPADTEAAADSEGAASATATTAAAATTPQHRESNKSKHFFYFYQASDGQHIYLQSINARCIVHEYGSLENGPDTITAQIVDKDILFMKEELRKRVRYLSHVPNACEFQVVEVQLKPPTVSNSTLRHFQGELKRRAQSRQKVRNEDRRMAKKQHIQEKMSYGIYPEVKLALDNPDQFPAPAPEVSERRRNSSLTDVAAVSLAPSSAAASELNASAAEFVPLTKTENASPAPASFSFAAALKKAKQPAPSASGATAAQSPAAGAAAGPVPARRADSEESDNEDRVPVPLFQNSFSAAISAKLDTLTGAKNDGTEASGKGGKKKKKEKKLLLFSTDMMRR